MLQGGGVGGRTGRCAGGRGLDGRGDRGGQGRIVAAVVTASQINGTGLAVDAPVEYRGPAVANGLHRDILGVGEGLAVEDDGRGVGGSHGLGTGGRWCSNGSDGCVTGRLDRGSSVGTHLVCTYDGVGHDPVALLAFGPDELRSVVMAECGQDLGRILHHGRRSPLHGVCDRTCFGTGRLDTLCGDLEGLGEAVTFLQVIAGVTFNLAYHSHGLLVHVCPVNADELVCVYVLFLTVDGDSRSVCVAIHLDGGLIELGLGLFAGGGDGHVVGNGQGVDASVGTDLHGDAAVLTHIDVGDASVGNVHSGSVTHGDVVDASGVNGEAGSVAHAHAVDLGLGTLDGDVRSTGSGDAIETSSSGTLDDRIGLGVERGHLRVVGVDTRCFSAFLLHGGGSADLAGVEFHRVASASADDEIAEDLHAFHDDGPVSDGRADDDGLIGSAFDGAGAVHVEDGGIGVFPSVVSVVQQHYGTAGGRHNGDDRDDCNQNFVVHSTILLLFSSLLIV